LIICTILILIVLTISVIVVDRVSWSRLCEQVKKTYLKDMDDCEDENVRTYFLIAGILQIFVTLFCCLTFVCCARGYYATLFREQGCLLEVEGYGRAQTYPSAPLLQHPPYIPVFEPSLPQPTPPAPNSFFTSEAGGAISGILNGRDGTDLPTTSSSNNANISSGSLPVTVPAPVVKSITSHQLPKPSSLVDNV
jgi:hypothetical protein